MQCYEFWQIQDVMYPWDQSATSTLQMLSRLHLFILPQTCILNRPVSNLIVGPLNPETS
jgi:hypothetical protein